MFKLDPNLEQYSTERQWEKLKAIEEHGSQRLAAKALGLNQRGIWAALQAVKKKAAQHGYAPESDIQHVIPEGFALNGVSDMRTNSEGKPQWLKYSADKEAQEEAARLALEALCEDIPRAKPLPPPKHTQADLCNTVIITDYHMGMLSWPKETGDDWNLEIAERTLTGCFGQMMYSAPEAETCVIAQLGDFLHSDGILPITPTSHNVLDQDGRFSKIVGVAIKALRRIIDMALSKHSRVHVIMAEGNHDITSSIWLRAMFAALYEDEQRVTVDDSVLPYYAYQHGQTMIGFHHGHLRKPAALHGVFAAGFPEMWGSTKYRYGHCGHMHHTQSKEDMGITITQHPTLSAKDAYAARGGWFAERKAACITYHKDHGQVGIVNVTPEMVA